MTELERNTGLPVATHDVDRIGADIGMRTAALAHKLSVLEHNVTRAGHQVRDAIDPRKQHQAHPWRSVGVAAAVGFLVGACW